MGECHSTAIPLSVKAISVPSPGLLVLLSELPFRPSRSRTRPNPMPVPFSPLVPKPASTLLCLARIASTTWGGMPAPESFMETVVPASPVWHANAMLPPVGVNLMALSSTLRTARATISRSAYTMVFFCMEVLMIIPLLPAMVA